MIRRAGYDSDWVTKGCLLRCDNSDPPDTTGHGSAAAADGEERSCPIHKGSRKNQPPIIAGRVLPTGVAHTRRAVFASRTASVPGPWYTSPHRSRPANIDHSERQSLPSCLPGPLAFDPLTTVGVGVLGGGCCSNRESRLARYAGSAVLGWGSRPEISASSARLGSWLQDHNGGLSRP